MKKSAIFLITGLLASGTFAQLGPTVYPAFYYTNGNYSNATTSNSGSFYMPFTWNGFDYITIGYDNLSIDNQLWEYKQQMYLASGLLNFYPFYFKPGYLHIDGKFDYKPSPFTYCDNLNLYSAELLFNIDLFYLGLSFDYSKLSGNEKLVTKHYGSSLLWIVSPEFSIELKPLYTTVTDGRKLFSSSLNMNYQITDKLLFKLNSFFGERAYFYDEDLLIMFNQNETQKNLVSFRVEYEVSKEFELTGSYQYTEFNLYTIKYLVAGIKFKFNL